MGLSSTNRTSGADIYQGAQIPRNSPTEATPPNQAYYPYQPIGGNLGEIGATPYTGTAAMADQFRGEPFEAQPPIQQPRITTPFEAQLPFQQQPFMGSLGSIQANTSPIQFPAQTDQFSLGGRRPGLFGARY